MWTRPPVFNNGDFLKHLGKKSPNARDTSTWIFAQDESQAWFSGTGCILWLAGRPGCGKLVLASSVVDHFPQRSSQKGTDTIAAVVYAFGNRRDKNKKTSAAFLRIAIWQILSYEGVAVPRKMQLLWDCRRTSNRSMPANDVVSEGQTEYLFKMFEKYTTMFPGMAVTIVGLDECPDAQGLAGLLSRSAVLKTSSVRILLASRTEGNSNG